MTRRHVPALSEPDMTMVVDFLTSGHMMLFAVVDWLIGPLTRCVVSSSYYIGVSLMTPGAAIVG